MHGARNGKNLSPQIEQVCLVLAMGVHVTPCTLSDYAYACRVEPSMVLCS